MNTDSKRDSSGAPERLLACISGGPNSEKLIRATRRLADQLGAQWYTVYVETPSNSKYTRENSERVWHFLRLAESLGAQVTSVAAMSIVDAIKECASRHGITRVVVGKPGRPRLKDRLFLPIHEKIIRGIGKVDVLVVSLELASDNGRKVRSTAMGKSGLISYLFCFLLIAMVTIACEFLRPVLDPTNMVMFYLLAVVIVSVRLGRKQAVVTSVLGVMAFDFFFVPPRLTFEVVDTQYLITFAALFVVGMVISSLVARAGERAEVLRMREVQTASLYYLSRDLTAAVDIQSVLNAVVRNVEEALKARLTILFPTGPGLDVVVASKGLKLDQYDCSVAEWAFQNGSMAGRGTDIYPASGLFFLPLRTPVGLLGVMGIGFEHEDDYQSQDYRRLADAFAAQASMAMERVNLAKQAEQAKIIQARENLERALLNSISHDLRTPLSSITGVLTSLKADDLNLPDQSRRELLDTACGEAERLNRFVANLLDMTRIESGAVRLKLEPGDVQDLVGCAIGALEPIAKNRQIVVRIEPMLPLVAMDMVLMTQVMVNLIENSLKYSPADSPVEIGAGLGQDCLEIEVCDYGKGIAETELQRVFDKFYRLPVPEGAGGTGLGLSICKGIVEAHNGSIKAENRPSGGLRMVVRLPLDGTGEF
ncbi:MAG TPA: DUF4118 domain-containing protein [Deltaproteobacteria bacterium]|nr:DUF4118 domain-containing protein [Deltaproteobacteria bacterium]